MSKCKGCEAEIKWVQMSTGGRMPLDPKPFKMVAVHESTNFGVTVDVYMPHWGTCPKAKDFKKK